MNAHWQLRNSHGIKELRYLLVRVFGNGYNLLFTISKRTSVVDVPLIPPNCLLSILPFIFSSIHFITIDSKTLAVNDIGLMSFSMDTGGFLLGNGITFAVFHSIGTTPSLRELYDN